MEKLDNFFEKVNGSYCGIIAVLIAAISVIVAQIMYITADPTFSMTTNYISDLGAGPNNSDIVFNVGEIIAGIFYIPFYIYIGWYLKKNEENISILRKGMIAGFVAGVMRSLVGVFPLDPKNNFSNSMHILVALILFVSLFIMAFIYGISERRNPDIPIILPILSFCLAILEIAFVIISIIIGFASIHAPFYLFLTEWSAFYVGIVWALAHIYHTLKNK